MINLSEFKFPTYGKGLLLKGSAAFLIGITFGIVLFSLAGLSVLIGTYLNQPLLRRFSSYDELRIFLNKSYTAPPYYYSTQLSTFRGLQTGASSATEDTASSLDYSKTNIQVEGVDEADIVKCDGEYLYLAINSEIFIVKAYPSAEAEVTSKIKLDGTIRGIFVYENKLVAFTEKSPEVIDNTYLIIGGFETLIKVYDIGNKWAPVQAWNISVTVCYFDSRMIENHVYILVTSPPILRDGEAILPSVINNGQVEEVEATSVYYSNAEDYYHAFTTIIGINIQTGELTHETFLLGSASCIYVSQKNIYVAIPKYGSNMQKTEIHRIHIENGEITCEASSEVPGYVLNQFSMDEYDEYFRIATTVGQVARTLGQATSSNNVYVLNYNLTIIGRLEDLAPGEKIHSARFIGERCYLVTFKKVDPLFVISLKYPDRPMVLGQLKIPGYSDYLHPYDENHLIGIGKETVEAEEEDFAWYQGVKISLFDVSDVDKPKEIDKYVIGDRGTETPVLSDHKALLFDKGKNLLAIPVLVAEVDEEKYPNGAPPYIYGDYVFQGVYVFNITENDLTLRSRITHIEDETAFLKSGYYFYSDYSVKRSIYIENVLYTISDKKIKMNSLIDFEEMNEVEIQ